MGHTNELLEKAANCFADGRPVDHAFLAENDVSFDECQELTAQIAAAIRNWARLKGRDKLEGIVRAAAGNRGDAEHAIALFRHCEALRRIPAELAAMGKPARPRKGSA